MLANQKSYEEFGGQLKDVLIKIYTDKTIENKNKLKIIRLMCQKYLKAPINLMFLTVYENIKKIEEKYMLYLPIDRMLPFEGLFIKSKVLDDLFKIILPRIVEIATD